MKMKLSTDCQVSTSNDLQKKKKKIQLRKKKCTNTLCAPTKQKYEKKHLLRAPVAP